jgi:hypothetical protein
VRLFISRRELLHAVGQFVGNINESGYCNATSIAQSAVISWVTVSKVELTFALTVATPFSY